MKNFFKKLNEKLVFFIPLLFIFFFEFKNHYVTYRSKIYVVFENFEVKKKPIETTSGEVETHSRHLNQLFLELQSSILKKFNYSTNPSQKFSKLLSLNYHEIFFFKDKLSKEDKLKIKKKVNDYIVDQKLNKILRPVIVFVNE